MKAFLLTAGLGTRLRPLTNDLPKCLLPINGKPLIQIWLELLYRHGVHEVLINTHWQYEKVKQYISADYADYTDQINIEKRPKFNIELFYEPELLGSGGTLLANRDWVADGQPFFILYGDNLTNIDLGKMYEFHLGHKLPFTLGVFRAERPESCGIAEIDEDNLVVDFVEKPDKPKSDLAAAGIYVADSRIFAYYPPNSNEIQPLDLGFDVIPNLVGKMKAYYIEEFLIDIGTADSYEKAQAIYPQITQITQK
jgi:mannose-1-phosphate guanylyltransferase